jgi:hypothetical protein
LEEEQKFRKSSDSNGYVVSEAGKERHFWGKVYAREQVRN